MPLKVYDQLRKGHIALYRQNKTLCRQNQTVRRHNEELLQHNEVLRKDIQALHERLSDHYACMCSQKHALTNLDQGNQVEESTLCHKKINMNIKTWDTERVDVEVSKKRLVGLCRVEEEVNDPHSTAELRHQVLKSQVETDIVPCSTKDTQGTCGSFGQNLKHTVNSDHLSICLIIDKYESMRKEKDPNKDMHLIASKREKQLLEEVKEMREINQVLNASIKKQEEEKESMCQKMEALQNEIQELKEMLPKEMNNNEEMPFAAVVKEGALLQEPEEMKEVNRVLQFLITEVKELEDTLCGSRVAIQQETMELQKMLQMEKDKNEEMLFKMSVKEGALLQELEEMKEVNRVLQFLITEMKEQQDALHRGKDALQQETKELKKMLQVEKDKNEEMLFKTFEKEEEEEEELCVTDGEEEEELCFTDSEEEEELCFTDSEEEEELCFTDSEEEEELCVTDSEEEEQLCAKDSEESETGGWFGWFWDVWEFVAMV